MTAALADSDVGPESPRDRHARILDATLALASTGGYDAVQMRAVAAGAGVAVGTLYRHFPSKAHLLIAALASRFEHVDVAPDHASTAGSSAQRLHQVISGLNRAWQRNGLLTEATVRAFVFADASAAGEIHHVEHLVDGILARAMSDGEPTEDHYDVARVISDVWLANLLAWLTGRASITDVTTRLHLSVGLLIGGNDDVNWGARGDCSGGRLRREDGGYAREVVAG